MLNIHSYCTLHQVPLLLNSGAQIIVKIIKMKGIQSDKTVKIIVIAIMTFFLLAASNLTQNALIISIKFILIATEMNQIDSLK